VGKTKLMLDGIVLMFSNGKSRRRNLKQIKRDFANCQLYVGLLEAVCKVLT
jgi:hypothetical protein